METKEKSFEVLVNESYNELDENTKNKVQDINKKLQINAKLYLAGVASTGLAALSSDTSLDTLKLAPDDLTYGLIGSLSGLLYSGFSNLYRNKHQKENQLVTKGPYSFHRNPEYTGDIIFFASMGSMLADAFYCAGNSLAAGLVLMTLGIFAKGKDLKIERDDLYLNQKFKDFIDYKNLVPKYLPNLSNLLR